MFLRSAAGRPPWRAGFARGLALAILAAAAVGSALAQESVPAVYLSEVQPDPRQGVRDADGDRCAWVEITNGGDQPVNLAGWFLTSDRANPVQWRFPGIALLPDKALVVLASGKDRSTHLAELHANFRLPPTNAYLALVDRRTNIVSELRLDSRPLTAGASFGSARGEPALRGVLRRSTPGKPNASDGDGFAPAVNFSRPSATFADPFRLELSCPGGGAVIRYTLNGTLPNRQSRTYSGPLEITNSTCVRARAYRDGGLPGPPASAAYLRVATNLHSFSSALPILVLDTFGQQHPVSTRATVAHLSVFEPVRGRSALTNRPALTTRVGHRVRGSTSSGMPQSGFAIEFVDEFNSERPLPLLGLPADSDWILYAPNAYDPVLIHNPFVHQLSRDLGRYSPRTRFVEMFVVTGTGRVRETHYHGLMVLEEKIKIGRQRVNIDRLEATDVAEPAVTGGYILKFDRLGPDESGAHFTGDRPIAYVEPKEQTIMQPQRAAQRRYITRYIADFERALDGPDWKDPVKGYPAYLDVDAAIDFHVLEVLSGNVDALVLSTYWHKPRGGRIVFGPHWDFDRALGSTDGRDENPRMWNTGPFFSGPWWDRLLADPDFWQRWVDRWQDLRRTHFAVTNLHRLIDQLAGEVRDAQPRQYRRWGFQPRGGSYEAELDHMKDWLANRLDFIDQQLVQPPSVTRLTDSVARVRFDAPTNVTVYYTLDGSDPRRPQGGIATNAHAYTAPIELPAARAVTVTARARQPGQRQVGGPPRSTPWSGPIVLR